MSFLNKTKLSATAPELIDVYQYRILNAEKGLRPHGKMACRHARPVTFFNRKVVDHNALNSDYSVDSATQPCNSRKLKIGAGLNIY
jgi:hypothetical protein